MDCAVDATDRLSFVTDVSVDGCKAKSWKSGTADTVAAVAWPDTEVAGGLGPELADARLCSRQLTLYITIGLYERPSNISRRLLLQYAVVALGLMTSTSSICSQSRMQEFGGFHVCCWQSENGKYRRNRRCWNDRVWKTCIMAGFQNAA